MFCTLHSAVLCNLDKQRAVWDDGLVFAFFLAQKALLLLLSFSVVNTEEHMLNMVSVILFRVRDKGAEVDKSADCIACLLVY